MEDQWLAWAKRLHALASTGLHFGADKFDLERYEEMAGISTAMLSALGGVKPADLTAAFPDLGDGYATPKIDVRGAFIENGKILLVQESRDGLWTLPGGYADIGLSPAENVAKEVWEEAHVRVRAHRLYALLHKAKHPYDQGVHDFYKFFFLCTREAPGDPRPGLETTEVGFFAPNAIPPLSSNRTLMQDIDAAYAAHADPDRPAIFD
ncbi:MAG: NUDIX hydrolase [Pseudomonadota bacterium]